ncbi:MAG: serine/threonine-protein kinase [Phycisphaerales bacterium]
MLLVAEAGLSGGEPEAHVRAQAASDPALLAEALSLLSADRASFPPLDDPEPTLGSTPDLREALGRLRGSPPGQLGGFMVRELIGAGATALVYRGWERDARTEAAIKVMPCSDEDARMTARFEAEASALSSLWHPGIVRVFAAGVDPAPAGKLLWIAMELVRGAPITEFARSESLSQRARIDLVLQACAAIAFAHERGVLHRDVKPANLLVASGTDGSAPVVKVVDFGVARIVRPGATGLDDASRRTLAGTLAYMAPEQIATGVTDARSDVYALASVLYELLADRPVIDLRDRTMVDALRMVIHPSTPRLRRCVPGIGRALDAVVHKALAPDPAARYPSVAEFMHDLEHAIAGLPVNARPPSMLEYGRLLWTARPVLAAALATAVISLAAGLVLVGTALHRADRAEDALRTEAADLKGLLAYLTSDGANRLAQLPASSPLRSSMLKEFEQKLSAILARQQPDSADVPELRRAYARVLDGLGDIALEQGDMDAATRYRERVIELLAPLATNQSHASDDLRADYSIALVKQGDLGRHQWRLDQTAACYLRALEIDQILSAASPENRRFLDNLVRSYARLTSEDIADKVPDRMEYSARAFELAQRLLARDVSNLTSAHAVVEASTCYTRTLLAAGRYAEAGRAAVAGLREGRRICRERPADRVFARDFARIVTISHSLPKEERPEALDAATIDAFAVLDAIALLMPEDSMWVRDNDALRLQVGDRCVAVGDRAMAIRLYRGGMHKGLRPCEEIYYALLRQVDFATRLLDLAREDGVDASEAAADAAAVQALALQAAECASPPNAAEARLAAHLLRIRAGQASSQEAREQAYRLVAELEERKYRFASRAQVEMLLADGRVAEAEQILAEQVERDPEPVRAGYRSTEWLRKAVAEAVGSASR